MWIMHTSSSSVGMVFQAMQALAMRTPAMQVLAMVRSKCHAWNR